LLINPGPQFIDEEQVWEYQITARNTARVYVDGLAPGMHWDAVNRRLSFTPDFIQGGKEWTITLDAIDGTDTASESFTVTVNNTIQPPWPTVVSTTDKGSILLIKLSQVTDEFLDSPGYAGRSFSANIGIPKNASATNIMRLRIRLHGHGGDPSDGNANSTRFGIGPHDSENSWWTGYNEFLPSGNKPTSGTIHNYTQRRVMHLLEYVIKNYPGVDEERIEIKGQSMGGTGAFFISTRFARHFATLSCLICGSAAQTMQDSWFTKFWGERQLGLLNDLGINMWDYTDATRAANENKDFRNLFISTNHAKNDSIIPFNSVVQNSPVTGQSLVSALNDEKLGHNMVWDQRGHSFNPDPILCFNWWNVLSTASLRRDLAFPAFSNASSNNDPGQPDGNGGYTGEDRGVINRYFRWDSANIVDTRDVFSIPLKLDINASGTASNGLPPTGNDYYGTLPIVTDITIRRIQRFQLLPGELVNWSFNNASGTVAANTDGSITIPNLNLSATTYSNLRLTR